MNSFVLFPFIVKHLANEEYMINGRPVALKATLMNPTISFAYRINLDIRMLDSFCKWLT